VTPDLRDQLERGLAGSYTLERELGAGGMSRVFVADDTSLRRKVVVKVLRTDIGESLSADRFKREIQLAARLQHPHIVPLLAAGALANGALYYTMPFVDGESLRDRLEREAGLPITDVTRFLRDITSALEYAHAQHVVHRDIKPENILLSHGNAVVADFGIAKAIHAARADGDGETRQSTTLTAVGTSLGTPAYMSPEQAAGDRVDHRADLYALGVVAYEMIAGRAPFDGRTAQQLLAAHASTAPEEIARRRANTPPSLAALVMQLLEKNPADRPQSATDVLHALDGAAPTSKPARGRQRGGPLVIALSTALLASLGALGWMTWTRPEPPAATRARVTLELPRDARLDPGAGFGNSMTFAPDGQSIVYVGGGPVAQLYRRRLDELTPHAITGTLGAVNPQISPDGREIGFVSNLRLMAVAAAGGTPRLIANGVGRFAWGPNGTIVFSRPSVLSPQGGLWQVSASGGTPTELTHPDTTLRRFQGSPSFLPDGRAVLFSSRPARGDPTLMVVRLADRAVIPLDVTGGSPLYFRDHIVFVRGDATVASVGFDPKRLVVHGEPVTVLENVALKSGGAGELAIAPNGTLAYLTGTIGQQLVEVDRRGAETIVLSKIDAYRDPRVAPDGRHIAITIGPPPYYSDIWVYDLISRTLTRLTTAGTNVNPSWTPDGKRIAWTSIGAPNATGSGSGGGVWLQAWDASGSPQLLIPAAEGAKFTRGGDSLVTSFDVGNATEARIIPLPYDTHRAATVVLPASWQPRQARLSADGHWLAYVSDETGIREVYIQRFPNPGGHFQISSGGGAEPVWGRKSTELTYRGGAALMSATLSLSPSVTVMRRDTLFSSAAALGLTEATYDVMPNGHFIMVRKVTTNTPPVLVFGWGDDLRRR
jgi:Tol biopolymer transport system component/tRNA A-37 threonylcarbamoyl transferase component Bud32